MVAALPRVVALACLLGWGLFAPARAPVRAEEELTVITSWAKNIEFAADALLLVDEVNRAGAGVVRLKYLGGPEVIPQRQMAYALKRGVVDLYFGAATYTIGLAPESDAFLGASITPMQARAAGAYAPIERIWNEKLNAHFLGWHQTGPRLHIFTRQEPRLRADGLPDVTGLRIRTTPTYRAFLDALGTTPIDIPSGDVYTALERGTVQAIAWTGTSMASEGFQKFVKVRIDPGVLGYAMTAQVNLDRWNRLSPAARAILEEQAERYEIASRERFLARNDEERRILAEQGVRGFELSPEAAAKYQALAVEAVWARMAEAVPEAVRELRPLFDPKGVQQLAAGD
ncbi:MAG: TRAP transporter substrate-binding protein DctP [Rhodospirillaceae bacterium]|nr:TRAP transporter substrate-binding protein DctP [Rhodospirillaceae bacterium]